MCIQSPLYSYYGTEEDFNEVHAYRRLKEVHAYLQAHVADEEERTAVKEAIAGDLMDLGMNIDWECRDSEENGSKSSTS